MKRDNDLMRDILFELETSDDRLLFVRRVKNSDPEREIRDYQVELLADAGLLVQISDSGFRMTNSGHDYLEAIRSDTVWQKTKEGAAKVGGMTLGMMKDLAVAFVKQEAIEKLGIEL